jgi:hypothetical protein
VIIEEPKNRVVFTHRAIDIVLIVVATNSYGIANGRSKRVGLGRWAQIALNLGPKLLRRQR